MADSKIHYCSSCPTGPDSYPAVATIQCKYCGEWLCRECWDEGGGAEGCTKYLVDRDGKDVWYIPDSAENDDDWWE